MAEPIRDLLLHLDDHFLASRSIPMASSYQRARGWSCEFPVRGVRSRPERPFDAFAEMLPAGLLLAEIERARVGEDYIVLGFLGTWAVSSWLALSPCLAGLGVGYSIDYCRVYHSLLWSSYDDAHLLD